jgi:hypothetical protein
MSGGNLGNFLMVGLLNVGTIGFTSNGLRQDIPAPFLERKR